MNDEFEIFTMAFVLGSLTYGVLYYVSMFAIRIICMIYGHEFRALQVFSSTGLRVVCPRCRTSWLILHAGGTVAWTTKIEKQFRARNVPIAPVKLNKL